MFTQFFRHDLKVIPVTRGQGVVAAGEVMLVKMGQRRTHRDHIQLADCGKAVGQPSAIRLIHTRERKDVPAMIVPWLWETTDSLVTSESSSTSFRTARKRASIFCWISNSVVSHRFSLPQGGGNGRAVCKNG